MVINQAGAVQQVNHYFAFGGLFGEGLQSSGQPYKYNGKELDRQWGLDMYDYGARHYDAALSRWFTVDLLAEKYYGISQCVYVANNPVRFIDPNGMDIWDIDDKGRVRKRVKDKTQDAFYMVAKNADGKYERTFTTDMDGNKVNNSISFEYGTITDSKKSGWFSSATSFVVNSVSSGAELFKFFADNTKIEYGLINTQDDGSTVMTKHKEGRVHPWSFIKNYHENGKVITLFTHNHPFNSDPSGFRKNSRSGDKFFVNNLIGYLGYSPKNYVYHQINNNLVLYDNTTQIIGRMSWGLVFKPSTARKHPVYPIRQYPGLGLPPP